jgi:uncharacterized protein
VSLFGQLCTGLLGLTAPGAMAQVLPPRQARVEPTVAVPRRASMRLAPEAPLIMGGRSTQREIDWATVLAPAKPPLGVVPDDVHPMAMDEDLFGAFEPQINTWAGESGYAELTWLGYPYLAELSQRSEYRQIVETLAKEMTRRWVKIVSKSEEDKSDYIRQLEEEINRFKVRQAFRHVAELDGFFGRGQIFIDVGTSDNSEELKTPLKNDITKIAQGSLKNLRVIEPMWTYPGVYNSNNPLAPDWYEPKQWYVMGKTVHASRLITFISREMPDLLKPAYSFGGISMSQLARPYVENWLRTRQSVSDMVHSFSITGLSTNMSGVLNAGGGGQEAIRAQMFNLMRDNRGLMMTDKETEEVFNVSAPLGTLDHLQAQAQEQMASVSHIPLVVLLGITPSGLNASSDGELRSFYSWVKSMQEHLFDDGLRRVLQLLQLNKFGFIDPDIDHEYVDLWETDEATKATTAKTWMDVDAGYVNAGALAPEEVRQRIAEDDELPYANIDLSAPAPGLVMPGEEPDDSDAPGGQPKPGGGSGASKPSSAGGSQPSGGSNDLRLAHDDDQPPEVVAGPGMPETLPVYVFTGPGGHVSVVGHETPEAAVAALQDNFDLDRYNDMRDMSYEDWQRWLEEPRRLGDDITYGSRPASGTAGGGGTSAPAQDEDAKPVAKHIFDGVTVAVECPKGDRRRTGAPKLTADYGYILRHKGADGDRLDAYVGPMRPEQLPVHVIAQHTRGGVFDEHKAMLGFQTLQAALTAYDAAWGDGSGPERRAGVETMSWEDFKGWLRRQTRDRRAEKVDRQTVGYHLSDSPSGRCDRCEYWNADYTCEKVIGRIDANGWCELFTSDEVTE